MKLKGLIKLLFLMVFLSVFSDMILAAEYPERDIRMICPYAAGGGGDAILRVICGIADKSIPVTIYVENITGALGGTGVYELMKSPPDGYTLSGLFYANTISVPFQKLIEGYSFDKLKLIAQITEEAGGIVVKNDSPWNNWEEFEAAVRENPGKITMGITGVGGVFYLRAAKLEKELGLKFNLIPYPGGAGEMKEAILSGELDCTITGVADFAELIEAGEARGLAEMAMNRNPKFPDIPTFKDLGYDNLVAGSFVILVTNAGTPEDRVKKLEEIFYEAQHSDEFRNWADQTGVIATWRGLDEIDDYVKSMQEEQWAILENLREQGLLE